MKPHRGTIQQRAHHYLLTWSAGLERAQGHGFPSAPMLPSVQGGKPGMSAPERYSQSLERWAQLDSAIRAVGRWSEAHAMAIRDYYDLALSRYRDETAAESWCARKAGISLQHWRKRMRQARNAFWQAYQAGEQGPKTGRQVLDRCDRMSFNA